MYIRQSMPFIEKNVDIGKLLKYKGQGTDSSVVTDFVRNAKSGLLHESQTCPFITLTSKLYFLAT